LLLTVVVGMGVAGLASRTDRSDRTAAAFDWGGEALGLLFGVLVVLAGGFLVFAVVSQLREGGGPLPQRRSVNKRARLITFGLLAVCILVATKCVDGNPLDELPPLGGGDPPQGSPAPPSTEGRASAAGSLLLLGLGAGLVMGAGLLLHLRQRNQAETERQPDVEGLGERGPVDGHPQALDLAAVEAEPDPRLAIRLAYAVLEQVAATTGTPRRPAEAPHQWLARLRAADSPLAGPARRLTSLYEQARFSDHTLQEDHRRSALQALAQAIDLADAAGSPAGP